jgi:hypothetical protein
MPRVPRLSKPTLILFCLYLVWAWFVASLAFSPHMPDRHDDTYYLLLARSFAEGEGYRNLSVPVPRNLSMCPSAFPLFLAPYWLLGAPGMVYLKVFLALLVIIGIWLSFLWQRRFLPRAEAYAITLAFASTPVYLMITNSVLSETLFIPLLYGAFLLTPWSSEEHTMRWRTWAALACYLVLARTRIVGTPFFGAFLIVLGLRRRWIPMAAGIGAFLLWVLFERAAVPAGLAGGGYVSAQLERFPIDSRPAEALQALFRVYAHNLWSFAGSLYARMLYPPFYALVRMNPVKRLIVVGVFCAACYGLWTVWRKHAVVRVPLAGFLLAVVPIMSCRRTHVMFRYLYPFFPFLTVGLLAAARQAGTAVGRMSRPARFAPLLAAVLIALSQGVDTLSKRPYDPWKEKREEHRSLCARIDTMDTPPGLLISPLSYYTYLQTGVPSFHAEDCRGLCGYVERNPGLPVAAMYEEEVRVAARQSIECGPCAVVPLGKPLLGAGTLKLSKVAIRFATGDRGHVVSESTPNAEPKRGGMNHAP